MKVDKKEGETNMLTREDRDIINNIENSNKLEIQLRDNEPCFKKEEIEKGLKKLLKSILNWTG